MKPCPRNFHKGQILIGIIIALGIFSILSQAVITLVFSAYDTISYTRARTNAQHIANYEIETIRNMPFDKVGTISGIPQGILPQTKTIIENGLAYTVKTSVVYIDDQFDGLAPDDILPNDYKRARIDVSWGGIAASKGNTVTLITDVSPKGIETETGGGTISILVFDSNSNPVPQANVQIYAPSLSPTVDLNLMTGSDGKIILPGAPTCTECYQITITKDGFSAEKTYSTAEIANPSKPHLTVIENELTEISFSIDRLSDLTIYTVDTKKFEFAPLTNQIIHLRGEKIIGTTEEDEAIYKYDQDVVSDSQGKIQIEDFEWDNYHITLPQDSTKVFAGSNPHLPVKLEPNTQKDVFISLADPSTPFSLLTIFEDSAANPIASVSAILKLNDQIEASGSAGISDDPDFGQIYFPDLENEDYILEATASGFTDYSNAISINSHKTEKIILIEE